MQDTNRAIVWYIVEFQEIYITCMHVSTRSIYEKLLFTELQKKCLWYTTALMQYGKAKEYGSITFAYIGYI